MRTVLILAACATLSGCAIFSGSADRQALTAAPPAKASSAASTAVRDDSRRRDRAFQPAFAAGAPTALVPCKTGARLSATCRRLTDRHQVDSEMPADDDAPTFSEATIISLENQP